MIQPSRNPNFLARLSVAGLVTVLALMLAVGGYIVARGAASSAGRAAAGVISKQAAAGCDRNQYQRAYDLLDERTGRAADDKIGVKRADVAGYYIRIVNCKATYAPSNTRAVTAYLATADQECFIRLVRAHHWRSEERPTTDPRELRAACVRSG